MHFCLSRVTCCDEPYQYAQLVESLRRKGGLPVHFVVANLGRVPDPVQLENLMAALSANQVGERPAPVTATIAEPATNTVRLRRLRAFLANWARSATSELPELVRS